MGTGCKNTFVGLRKRKKHPKKKERKKRNSVYHTKFFFHTVFTTGRVRVKMKKWFHVFFKNRWGRGQPDEIGAINLGDEKFDPDSDKKPRAGQILWIRGLTRLQTQVTIPISVSLYLCLSLSYTFSLSLSFSHSLIISSLNKKNILSYSFLTRKKTEMKTLPKKTLSPPPDPANSVGENHIKITLYFSISSFREHKKNFFSLSIMHA